MEILTLSDLHLSRHQAETRAVIDPAMSDLVAARSEADAIVVAGDITDQGDLIEGLRWIRFWIPRDVPVIIVLGNHDYFGHSIPGAIAAARAEAKALGMHFLENDAVVIDGVKFIGATLWTDFDIYARGNTYDLAHHHHHAANAMEDFKGAIDAEEVALGHMPKPFRTKDSVRLFKESVAHIDAELNKGFDGPVCVVTHHMPHPEAIAPEYQNHDLTPAFCSDLCELIDCHQPAVWIHGHTHSTFDDELDCGTRLVCNPRGLNGENIKFDWSKMISISPTPRPKL